jgi:hypothetical protein
MFTPADTLLIVYAAVACAALVSGLVLVVGSWLAR